MIEGISATVLLRIAIVVAALVLFAVIVVTGRRKPEQGKRKVGARGEGPRHEPSLREILESEANAAGDEPVARDDLDMLERPLAGEPVPDRRPAPKAAPGSVVAGAPRVRTHRRGRGAGGARRSGYAGKDPGRRACA